MIYRHGELPTEVRERMRGGNGRVALTPLTGELPDGVRVFSTISLTPGDSIGYHVHEGESELFYFAKGRARVADNDRSYEVEAGDAMLTPSGSGHSVENVGDSELIVIAIVVLDRQ